MRGRVSWTADLHCYRCGKHQPTKVTLWARQGEPPMALYPAADGWRDKDGRFLCDHCGVNGEVVGNFRSYA